MTTHSDRTPDRTSGFHAYSLHADILRGINAAGFTDPRPIQHETIPAALDGRDILGLAQTGTGKTAAFALPLLQRLGAQRRSKPRALIVAPTRELASQIRAEIETLGRHTGLRITSVYGGVSLNPQIRQLRRGVDVLVACPGRLLDLHRQGAVDLQHVQMLVLDEADHMFDMGFLPDIRRIFRALPSRRQNLLFSATMPREIRSLADDILDEPHVVELAHSAPAETVEHVVYPVHGGGKIELLRTLLEDDDFTTAIVFARTKRRTKQLAEKLSKSGHRAIALQGNMSQNARDRAMKGFRNGNYDVLVATDIAARGIDVAAVSHVINYDMPDTVDAYTHRIGRTGRATLTGVACSFVEHGDRGIIRAVESALGEKIRRIDVPGHTRDEADRTGGDRNRDDRDHRSRDRDRGGRRPGGNRNRSNGGNRNRNGNGRHQSDGTGNASRNGHRDRRRDDSDNRSEDRNHDRDTNRDHDRPRRERRSRDDDRNSARRRDDSAAPKRGGRGNRAWAGTTTRGTGGRGRSRGNRR